MPVSERVVPLHRVDAATQRQRTIERFRLRYETRKSERTAEIYAWAASRLDAWLTATGDHREFTELDTDALEDFLDAFEKGRHGFDKHSRSYTHQIYRSLRVFFGWLTERYELDRNPMAKVESRQIGEQRIENKVLTDAQLSAILDTVAHNRRNFAALRDHAMLRLFLTGVRRNEMAGITVADVDLNGREIRVVGKADAAGPRVRYVPFGKETLLALMDYLEVRDRHKLAHRPELWIGSRGVLTGRGIHRIVSKRGEQAGIPGVHPHMFRHTTAHRWLADSGGETDLMTNMGWKSRSMVDLYAASTKAERARQAWRDRGLDDRIV